MEASKSYLVTLSTGAPDWKTSKWNVDAESKSQALHYALLMHDDTVKWPVSMVTISYENANPELDLSLFTVGDPEYIYRLDRIYRHGKERLENC